METDSQPKKIITRAEAKALGLKRYFTGNACKNGHVAEKYTNCSLCVVCSAANTRRNYTSNREIMLEKQKARWIKDKEKSRLRAYTRRATRESWPQAILTTCRTRCRKALIQFNIEAEDIQIPDVCPIMGVPFVFGLGPNHPLGPSVDRIKPELGYVKGNVCVISRIANRIKSDCTIPAVFRAIANYIEREVTTSVTE